MEWWLFLIMIVTGIATPIIGAILYRTYGRRVRMAVVIILALWAILMCLQFLPNMNNLWPIGVLLVSAMSLVALLIAAVLAVCCSTSVK